MLLSAIACWRVIPFENSFRLVGVVFHITWQPGRPMTCESKMGNKKLEVSNTSGIYAFNNPKYLNPMLDFHTAFTVDGEVSLWGKVIKAEHGYRAEFAYPRKLFVPNNPTVAAALRRDYGIEVNENSTEKI